MSETVEYRCGQRTYHLQSGAYDSIWRHWSVCDNPRIRGFALQVLGNENDMFVFESNGENFGNVNVIEFLS